MQSIHTIPTPDGMATVTSGCEDAGEPYVYQEGPATVLRVGRFEISVDPQETAAPIEG